MTEAEWYNCTDPEPMLAFLRDGGRVSKRKLPLFSVACCRRVWDWLTDRRSREAVVVAERFVDADRKADPAGHLQLRLEVMREWEYAGGNFLLVIDDPLRWATEYLAGTATRVVQPTRQAEERQAQAALLRDIMGNPFRPVAIDPAWLTGSGRTVHHLAEAAYTERELPSGHLDRARLGVLADALEEAACRDADLLDHLRGPGPHVRGCFALDALLGKE